MSALPHSDGPYREGLSQPDILSVMRRSATDVNERLYAGRVPQLQHDAGLPERPGDVPGLYRTALLTLRELGFQSDASLRLLQTLTDRKTPEANLPISLVGPDMIGLGYNIELAAASRAGKVPRSEMYAASYKTSRGELVSFAVRGGPSATGRGDAAPTVLTFRIFADSGNRIDLVMLPPATAGEERAMYETELLRIMGERDAHRAFRRSHMRFFRTRQVA